MKADIVIIGGGLIGSSIAYFLARTGRAGSVAVIEPDSEYALAATSSGAGGVRQLFSQPENIWMSRFSLEFYADFASTMAVGDVAPPINFERRGYLFVVAEEGAAQLEANYRRQVSEGVKAELLDRSAVRERFPSLGSDDITLACLSPKDGTITTSEALKGFRRKAESLGVSYVDSRVTAFEGGASGLRAAVLEQGEPLRADLFVNAAGAWAGEVAAMAGMSLPVVPMCRQKHFWRYRGEREIEPLPLVKDESGLFFRPQAAGFVGGRPSWQIEPGFFFDAGQERLRHYFDGYFERVVRPLLAVRVPSFDSVVCEETWTGHYAQNTLDGNMILGPWIGGATNFTMAAGFSGHGGMHAPAVGLAMSELILDGRYSTMDLSRMSYQRVLDDEPYQEQGIK